MTLVVDCSAECKPTKSGPRVFLHADIVIQKRDNLLIGRCGRKWKTGMLSQS